MAKKQQPQQPQPKARVAQQPIVEAAQTSARRKETSVEKPKEPLLFGRINYILMLIGVALIGLGMVAMSGGAQPNPETWDPNIIYSTRIIHVAPILILAGLGMQIYAIFKRA